MQNLTEPLRLKAKELLEQDAVQVVIGYGPKADGSGMTAVFVRRPEDVDQLELNDACFQNLVTYLNKPEVKKLGKPAIVVKGCDRRALNVLMLEQRFSREDVCIVGVSCDGVGDPRLQKCSFCSVHNPQDCDVVLGDEVDVPTEEGQFSDIDEFEKKSLEERWEFWREKIDECIRCYACRQVCPLCYCQRCVVEKNIPQWVESSPHRRGNLAWNVVRGFHLTGRCIGCGECERVCPMDIPIGLINQKLAKLVEVKFDFVSGMNTEDKSPFSTYDLGIDTDEGIM